MSSQSFLHGIDTIEVIDGVRPVRTLKSSVIGFVGTAGKGPVNLPVLITGNSRDAASIFGAYTSDGFSIPKALNAIFKQGAATVVVINVCDPLDHLAVADQVDSVVLSPSAGKTSRGFIDPLNLVLGTAISAPYTVSSLGTTRSFPTVSSGAGTKAKLTVTNPLDYEVGEAITITGSSVAGYNGTTTVLASDVAGVTIDVAYTATATGIASAPASDRVVLPTGATLVDVRNRTTNAVIALEDLAVGQRVKLNYTATLVVDVDYTVNFETGTITRVADAKLLPNATFEATYGYVDPSVVTESEIIGGTDGAGDLTGIAALAGSMAELNVRPRLLMVPGYTLTKLNPATRNPVAVALAEMALKLRATCYVSATNGTKESATGYASDFSDPRLMVLYPSVNFAKPGASGELDPVTLDALTVGLIAAVDNAPDGGFWHSPSNRLLNGPISLTKPIDWGISDTESMANYLNENNVTVAIREEGFRLWGNRMSDGTFITVRRTADMIEDSIAAAHRWAVARNITKGYLSNLVENVNSYLGILERQGAILGGKAWVDPTLNTRAEIMAGHIYVDYEFTPPVPAERITFRAHIVDTYVSRIFTT